MSSQTKKHYWLYVLTLEEGKHYVGITAQTPEKRFEEHLQGIRFAYWTIKYRPLDILYSEDLGMLTEKEAKAYENKVVRKYMKERGYNNTRGGDLTDEEDYKVSFGKIYYSDVWNARLGILLMSMAFAALFILYFVK